MFSFIFASKKLEPLQNTVFIKKHFSKVFSLFLKHFGNKNRKKSIFFKMKPCIENRLVEKLDMVTYFTPLAALGIIWKIERQVSYQHCLKNSFFMLIQLCSRRNRFWARTFDFWKIFKRLFWAYRVVEKHSLGPGGGVLGNQFRPSRMH